MMLTEKTDCSYLNQVTLLKEILSNPPLYQHCSGIDSKLIISQILFWLRLFGLLIFFRRT
jgi:hypothetical protein